MHLGPSIRLPRPTLEESLGPAEARYFATGYREVRHEIVSIDPPESNDRRADAVAEVTYPPNWSAKATGVPRVPHVSSVDAIILTVLAWQRATPQLLQHGWRLVSADLRAGTRPWLELARVPVTLDVSQTQGELLLKASVGTIGVRLRLRNSPGQGAVELGSPDAETVYESLYKQVATTSVQVAFDTSRSVLSAEHAVSLSSQAERAASGLDGAQWPAVSAIDYLVTMGQLAQIVIYQAAGLSRADVDDLWMRSMSLDLTGAPAGIPLTYATQTSLVRDRTIDRGGRRIHDVLVQSFASTGVIGNATLAYTERDA